MSTPEARVRRPLLGVAAIVLAIVAGAAPAQGQGRAFSIDRFAVSITVHPDASLDVREAITFDFRGSHQGVYRVIPVRYPRGGFEFALRLDGVQVLDEQFRPLKTNVSYSGRYVRIKAWVPGAVNTTKTVTVVYRVRRGLFNVDDHEELYWNVTGDEWDVPIRQAEAVVIGPPAAVPGDARAIAYTGSRGIAGTDYVEQRDGNVLTFRTTRPLRPREGLTIAVAWPPGVVGRPAAWRSAVWFLQDNWPLGLPFLALALGLFAWRSYGRDPGTRRSIKPEYAPPDDLAPAEAGVLVSERAHPSDVVATIVDLAVRGYMRIEPVTRADDEPDFLLRRLKPILGDPAIRPFELFVLAKLFDTDWRLNMRLLSEVRRDYDNVFAPIRDEMYRTMVKRRLFPTSPDSVRRIWLGLGLGILARGRDRVCAAAVVGGIPERRARAWARAERARDRHVLPPDAEEDLGRGSGDGPRAGLPRVPRACGEGSAGAHACRHAASLAALGHRARGDGAVDLAVRRPPGRCAGLVRGRSRILTARLRALGGELQPARPGGDHDDAARGPRRRRQRRERDVRRLVRRGQGRWRRRDVPMGRTDGCTAVLAG